MNNQTDSELIEAYLARADETIFTEIVTRHGPMVYRVCRGILGDAHEAEDCSQAVFLVLVRKAKTLRKGVNLSAWLYSVARHVSLRAIQTRHRRAKREKEAAMLSRDEASHEESTAEQAALLAHVYDELSSLSAVQRQAVILRHLEARSEVEAAGIAGCEPRTLAKRASDGVKKLRKRLTRGGCTLGLAALVGLLETEAQAAVPETLISSIVTASQVSAAGAGAGAATLLAEGTMKMMMWTKIKMAASVAMACAVVGVGITFIVAGQDRAPKIGPPIDRNATVRRGTPGKKKDAEERVVQGNNSTFRVFKSFPIDPLMSGWQNDGRRATTIQNPAELKKFYAKIRANKVYSNPRFWKGETPDVTFKKALKKYKINIEKEALVCLRYGMGSGDKIVVDTPRLEEGILKCKVSHKYMGPQGPRNDMAILSTIAVAVNPAKVKKVVFELPGNRKEEATITPR